MKSLPGTWITDGSEADGASARFSSKEEYQQQQDTQTQQTAAVITNMQLSKPRGGGSPMNLLYKFESSSSACDLYFFQLRVVEMDPTRSASLSVGVVRQDEFHKGYKTKGMFYNGNVTNGSAALKTSVGPFLKQGDVVVVCYKKIAEENDDAIELKVIVNGSDIGTIFKVHVEKSSSAAGDQFYPCIHFQGDLVLDALVSHDLSATFSSGVEDQSTAKDPLEGKWKIDHVATTDGTESDRNTIISASDFTLTIQQVNDTNNWDISAHICNNMSTRITLSTAESATNDMNTVRNVLSRGPVRSTMMMPPPPMDEIERKISTILEAESSSFHVEDASLYLKDANGGVLIKCSRPVQSNEPICTSYKN